MYESSTFSSYLTFEKKVYNRIHTAGVHRMHIGCILFTVLLHLSANHSETIQ